MHFFFNLKNFVKFMFYALARHLKNVITIVNPFVFMFFKKRHRVSVVETLRDLFVWWPFPE